MKAEERHEERENDAAGWLQYGFVNFIREYGSYFLLAIALAFLGYQLWNMHLRTIDENRRKAQDTLRTASVLQAAPKSDGMPHVDQVNGANPDKLADLIDSTEFKDVKARAALTLAGFYHALIAFPNDLKEMKLSREEALNKAAERYQQALEFQGDDALIASHAHLGLAAVYEDRGEKEDWEKARAEYNILASKTGMFAGTGHDVLGEADLVSLPERMGAPRLASMIPAFTPAPTPAPTPTPGIPGIMGGGGLLGPMDNTQFGNILGPNPTPRPANIGPALPPTPAPMGPFQGPSIPNIAPTPQPEPAATTPAAATSPVQ